MKAWARLAAAQFVRKPSGHTPAAFSLTVLIVSQGVRGFSSKLPKSPQAPPQIQSLTCGEETEGELRWPDTSLRGIYVRREFSPYDKRGAEEALFGT